jgi:hypothetical protein
LLEFNLDVKKYTASYNELIKTTAQPQQGQRHLSALWEELMQTYIVYRAPRELNISSHVRDHLLLASGSSIFANPHPSELRDADQCVVELLDGPVFTQFLELATPTMHHKTPREAQATFHLIWPRLFAALSFDKPKIC